MASIPKGLAAKARLKMSDGVDLYIEVRKDSRLSNFCTTYTAQGRGRKRVITEGVPINVVGEPFVSKHGTLSASRVTSTAGIGM